MRITFGNATVKRLESERTIAERLNHLRLFKITECLLRIQRGDAFRDIAEGLHISLRTVEVISKKSDKEVASQSALRLTKCHAII